MTPEHKKPGAWYRRWPALLLGPLFFLIAVGFTWPHFGGLHDVSRGLDWSVFQLHLEVARRSVLEYGQIPFWNPYLCGGTTLIGNPQTTVLSPWQLLHWLFGVQLGLRLEIYGHLTLAMLGMWWWARRRGLTGLPAVGAGLAFGLSGFFAAHIAWGHHGFLSFAYLPLVMLAYEAARDRLVAAVGLGAVVALMLIEGGAYPVPMTVVVLALRVGHDVVLQPRRAGHLLLVGAVAGAIAFGLTAPKLLPMLVYITEHKRSIRRRDMMLLSQVLEMFLSRDTSKKAAGYIFNRYEYFNYLGPIVFASALWGLWQSRRHPYREIFILVGLIALLMIGLHGPWSPYAQFLKLPFFNGMRQPARYTVYIGMFLALCFGYALSALSSWIVVRSGDLRLRALVALPIALFVVDAITANAGHWSHNAFRYPPVARQQRPFVWLRGGGAEQYQRVMANQGSANCFAGVHIPGSPRLRLDTPEFVWFEGAVGGEARLEFWSPNHLIARVDSPEGGQLSFNQNAIRGWQVVAPAEVEIKPVAKLLSVVVPAGPQRVELRYVAPGFWIGVGIAGATLLALASLLLWRWRRANRL